MIFETYSKPSMARRQVASRWNSPNVVVLVSMEMNASKGTGRSEGS